ncbi:MAG: hypothetical protein JWQ09_1303 [Segetibacter sp.]|nr:hypothetical protein [Segetibacter sp.]
MRRFFYFCLTLTVLLSCKKENDSKVDIYMLKSFTVNVDQTTTPAILSISNAILADAPFVTDKDIAFYTKSTATFKLKKDIKSIIQHYGPDKAFAVTINNRPVYFGKFHPAYLSSITFGVATIDPIPLNERELRIQFATLEGDARLLQLDKRNESEIINTLKATNRIR